jgi:predicted metalloprotease
VRGTDIVLSDRRILPAEHVDLHMMGEINDRFSPNIVTMEFEGEWSQFDETVRWLKTRPTELSNFLKDNASGVAQNVGSVSLVKLMNEVAWS